MYKYIITVILSCVYTKKFTLYRILCVYTLEYLVHISENILELSLVSTIKFNINKKTTYR